LPCIYISFFFLAPVSIDDRPLFLLEKKITCLRVYRRLLLASINSFLLTLPFNSSDLSCAPGAPTKITGSVRFSGKILELSMEVCIFISQLSFFLRQSQLSFRIYIYVSWLCAYFSSLV
jgi:hypothetical protein